MGTRMQDEHSRLRNAMMESKVQTVIELYDLDIIQEIGQPREDISNILSKINVSKKDIEYWLDWFGVKN